MKSRRHVVTRCCHVIVSPNEHGSRRCVVREVSTIARYGRREIAVDLLTFRSYNVNGYVNTIYVKCYFMRELFL